MTVGTIQLTDLHLTRLMQDAQRQWDIAEGGNIKFAFVLVGDTHTIDDTDSTVADLGSAGTGGTEAAVAADTADWINGSADGSPITVPSRSVVEVSGNAELRGGDANFGAAVTISGVKYLAIVECADFNGSAVQQTDTLHAVVNLRTEDAADVSSTASDFNVTAPQVGGQDVWRRTLAQA